MENLKHLYKLGFRKDDFDEKSSLFSDTDLEKKLKNQIFFYGKSKSAQTASYFIFSDDLTEADLKEIQKKLWNESLADLMVLYRNKSFEIKYLQTNPKEPIIDISRKPVDENDSLLLEKISKQHFDTGLLWVTYYEALDKIKKSQTKVDKALIATLENLRKDLKTIYKNHFSSEIENNKLVQALIDRTLFIRFLEDKHVLNSEFSKFHFGENLKYKDILQRNDNKKQINKLFTEIHKIFNNKLFAEPTIDEDDLLPAALHVIAKSFNMSKDNQLSLFDYQFDVIPVEFISHIYQIFLDDKKQKEGIFYTPEGLAELVLEYTLTNGKGTVLDPACGAGIFLVLAFRKMYENCEQNKNVHQEIKNRMKFVQQYIFGIEKEYTARRLAVFSLYLEILNKIPNKELNLLVTELLHSETEKLFPEELDFSPNIKHHNTLDLENPPVFEIEKFDYLVGNPPWFRVENTENTENKYWNKYQNNFTLEKQLSQCFIHKTNDWSNATSNFGFVVNSSLFQNDKDKFQKYFFSTNSLKYFFEFSNIAKILFETASEHACVIIFENKNAKETIFKYINPKLNHFAKTFETVLLPSNQFIDIKQDDINKTIKIRDFLHGNKRDVELVERINFESSILEDFIIQEKNYSKIGFLAWDESALKKEFKINRVEIDENDYKNYKLKFTNKYFSNYISESNKFPSINPTSINSFRITNIKYYLPGDISNFARAREQFIYENEKILCPRVSSKIIAAYTDKKIYFDTDVYVIKLQNKEYYHIFTAILNSQLVNYFLDIKLRKRIDGNFPKINVSDLLRIPIPHNFNNKTAEKLDILSRALTAGDFTFEEKKDELNELVFDLYGLNIIEKNRIRERYMPEKNNAVTNLQLFDYCLAYFNTYKHFLDKDWTLKFDYYTNNNLPIFIAGVKISFVKNDNSHEPQINEVVSSINNELLKNVTDSGFLSLNEKIRTAESTFIIKEKEYKHWTTTGAVDDAKEELNLIYPQ